MTQEKSAWDAARVHLKRARAAVDALDKASTLVSGLGDEDEVAWPWLRDQLLGLAERLRAFVAPTTEQRELYSRAWSEIRKSAQRGVDQTRAVLRGDFQGIVKTASSALGVVSDAFHLHLGGWAVLAVMYVIATSAARDR